MTGLIHMTLGALTNGFDVGNGRNGVVADGDSCVGGILDGTCPRSLFDIVGGDFVPEYIGGYKALTLGGCQPLEQFDYGFATLAEAREDERTTLVVDTEKMGKSGLDVAEGYGEVAVCDGVFVECSPGVEGDVAIMGGTIYWCGCENMGKKIPRMGTGCAFEGG